MSLRVSEYNECNLQNRGPKDASDDYLDRDPDWDENPPMSHGLVDGYDDMKEWVMYFIIQKQRKGANRSQAKLRGCGLPAHKLASEQYAHLLHRWFASAWVQLYKVPIRALWWYVNYFWIFLESEAKQNVGVKIPAHPHALWLKATDIEDTNIFCAVCDKQRFRSMYCSSKEQGYRVCNNCVRLFEMPQDKFGSPTRKGSRTEFGWWVIE